MKKTFLIINVLMCLSLNLVGCDKNLAENKTIKITTKNVNNYFRSHVEVYESGYGFTYELTVTPKTAMKSVDLKLEVSSTVDYTYTFIGNSQPIYHGTQINVMPITLDSKGYGFSNSYKATGTNIINCSLYVEVTYTKGRIELA